MADDGRERTQADQDAAISAAIDAEYRRLLKEEAPPDAISAPDVDALAALGALGTSEAPSPASPSPPETPLALAPEPALPVEEPPLQHYVRSSAGGMLPHGGIHLLGGSPHAGKSTILAQLLSQFVSPTSWFLPSLSFSSLDLNQIGVIFADRPWRGNSAWLELVGLGEVPHLSLADDPRVLVHMSRPVAPGQAPGVELLRFCLDLLPSTVKLVVVDVFTNAFVGNLFHTGVVYRHMLGHQHMLRERGLTLLGTCYGNKLHEGKNERYRRAIDRIIGAAPFRGSADSILFLDAAEESDKDYQRLTWYSRHAQERHFAISRGPEGLFRERRDVVLESSVIPPEAPSSPLKVEKIERRGRRPDEATMAKIVSLVGEGEAVTRPELALRAANEGVARTTVYRALKRLVRLGLLVWDEERGTITRPRRN